MIRKLILSQGDLAHQMLAAAEKIAGEMPEFEAMSLSWDDSFDTAQRKIETTLKSLGLDDDQPILILTDMYGGTPHNVAVTFCRPGRVETVTGINLPMVVRLGCHGNGDLTLHELAAWIQEKGRRSICTTEDCAPCSGETAAHAHCNHD